MSDQNLDGFNSKPTKDETSYADPITPEPDEVSSKSTEVETEVILGVDEADVAEAPLPENSTEEVAIEEISQSDQIEAPSNLPIINTSYASPDNESSQPEVEESESEQDSSIEALPKEKVERKPVSYTHLTLPTKRIV